jgi:hypothetical protein
LGSESLSLLYYNEFLEKIFFGPFTATFGKNRPEFGHELFRPTLFFPAPFELFGRNFGHLATLPPTPTSG